MNISIDRATTADATTLVKLQIRAFHDDARLYPGVEAGGPPGYDSVDAMLADLSKHDCYKISYEGQIVGGITVVNRGQEHYHLDKIYVDPDYHNLGIGTQAMLFIEETYPAVKWTLDTPLYALRNQHFYEKLGCMRVDEIEADGIVLVGYEKHLVNG